MLLVSLYQLDFLVRVVVRTSIFDNVLVLILKSDVLLLPHGVRVRRNHIVVL